MQQLDGLLDEALQQQPGDPALQMLLEGLPALAVLHENRHYAQAGLCRSPLEPAIEAERAARDVLARFRKPV